MDSQRETEQVPEQVPYSQGDIIKIEQRQDGVGPSLGVVINADCDLAHDKTDGVIAFLPIYLFHDYLAEFWAPVHLQNIITASAQVVRALVSNDSAQEYNDKYDTLFEWLKLEGVEAVYTSLSTSAHLRGKKSEQLHRELQKLEICLESEDDAITRFKKLCRLENNPQAYARNHVTSAKKAMGEGHFFISDLVGSASVGFVIRMRRIYTIPMEDLYASTSEQMSKSPGDRLTAVRVARLTQLYRVKVIQLFAQQYSRVGLPDDVTVLSKIAIEDLVEKLTGETK